MRLTPPSRNSNLLDIDITAMIDVVFLLIIFFMTTAQFTRMTRARIDLPREVGEKHDNTASAGMIVNVSSDGAIIIDQQVVSMDRLVRMVAVEVAQPGADGSDIKLTIRADRSLSARILNDIARALASAGLRGVRLATEPPAGGGS